jgi:flagellin
MISPTNPSIFRAIYNMNILLQRNETLSQLLSTGKRINSPGDNPSLFYRISKLQSEMSSYDGYLNNIQDGLGLISTLNEATTSQISLLEEMRNLAIEAQNGSQSNNARTSYTTQIKELIYQFDNIAATSSYNGQKLLDGTTSSISITTGNGSTLSIDLESQLASNPDLGDSTIPNNASEFRTLEGIKNSSKTSFSSTEFAYVQRTVEVAMEQLKMNEREFGTDEFILNTRETLLKNQKNNLENVINNFQEVDLLKTAQELEQNKLLIAYSTAAIATMQELPQLLLSYLYPSN